MSETDSGRVGDAGRADGPADPNPAVSAKGAHPSRVVHLRNGRAARHPQVYGEGVTWCGKKLLGKPESQEGCVEIFNSYGSELSVSFDPADGTCARCCETFEAAYAAAFPEGLKPIATFCADNPADIERARSFLSPEALNGFFGPGGGGMAAFHAAIRDSDRSGGAIEPAKTGSTEGEGAGPEGIAHD